MCLPAYMRNFDWSFMAISPSKRKERGSILPYISVATAVIAIVAVALMLGFGSAAANFRSTHTAADAAALAAARSWANSIETSQTDSGKQLKTPNLDAVNKKSASTGTSIKASAERYASLNGASVTAISIDQQKHTVSVTVRSNSRAKGTGTRFTATSKAVIKINEKQCSNQKTVSKNSNCSSARSQTADHSGTSAPSAKSNQSDNNKMVTKILLVD